MFSSAVLDLRFEPSWEPGRLTAEAFRWPVEFHQVAIRDIAPRLAPRSFAEAGAPVIGPGDIDSVSGGVRRRGRKYQGSVYQVGAELRDGDVLLPRTGTSPALLVSDHLRGALVSSRFHALRAGEATLGLWLWGLLSCESGQRWRATLTSGTVGASMDVKTVLDATVPVPPLAQLRSIADRLRDVHAATRIAEEEAVETWWQTTDLRVAEWRTALATPNPAELTNGEPFGDYFGEIRRGRNTRDGALDSEAPGYLPVADVSMLGGKPPRRWLSPDGGSAVVAEPGDLLVAALGKQAHTRVADRRVVADSHVIVARPRNRDLGPALAQYLNSQAAYRIRQFFLTGSTIPSLSVADLRRFPVPHHALTLDVVPDARPLARRLEQVLWQS